MTEQPALRLVVTRGGEPTPEQTAAMVLALTAIRPTRSVQPAAPGWQRAALHEGVGGAAAVSAPDLAGRGRAFENRS